MKPDYELLVGKTCFYRTHHATVSSARIIASIEHRHNLRGDVETSAIFEDGETALLTALWFAGLPEQGVRYDC